MKFFNRKADDAADMSFLQHLEALRWHLVRSVIAILVLSVVVFSFKEFLFDTILFGPKQADFPTYQVMCMLGEKLHIDGLCIREIPFKLQSIELSQQFMLHMWSSIVAGFILAFPYVFYEIWKFISPALSEKELAYTRGVVFFTSLLFITGVLFGYYVIAPLSINFLGSYTVSNQVENIFTLDSFVSIITMLTLASGIVFELPIVVYFLSKIGLLTPAFMRHYRKHAIVFILIIAALITPSPDVTSQMLVFVPLYFLYEISIFISAAVVKNKTNSV